MSAEQYFLELSRAIKNLASKADLILFEGAISKEDWEEVLEDIIILHVFHIGAFKLPSTILSGFIEKKDIKDKLNASERKALGAFFTPPYIAQFIVQETLGPMIDNIEEDRRIKKKIEKICDLKICDPAMGVGIFLVCAHDYLMERIMNLDHDHFTYSELSRMSSKAIFGVDINPKTVEFSKLILNLNIAKWSVIEKLDEYAQSVK